MLLRQTTRLDRGRAAQYARRRLGSAFRHRLRERKENGFSRRRVGVQKGDTSDGTIWSEICMRHALEEKRFALALAFFFSRFGFCLCSLAGYVYLMHWFACVAWLPWFARAFSLFLFSQRYPPRQNNRRGSLPWWTKCFFFFCAFVLPLFSDLFSGLVVAS